MSESFEKAVEAAAEAMSGWRFIEYEPGCGEHTELSEPARAHYARDALRAALPHLTAQDVPNAARVAWEMGRAMGLADHSGSIMAGRPLRTPNPYAEEGQ